MEYETTKKGELRDLKTLIKCLENEKFTLEQYKKNLLRVLSDDKDFIEYTKNYSAKNNKTSHFYIKSENDLKSYIEWLLQVIDIFKRQGYTHTTNAIIEYKKNIASNNHCEKPDVNFCFDNLCGNIEKIDVLLMAEKLLSKSSNSESKRSLTL